MPTSVSRGLPSEDAGSTLPVDAKDWQNRANAEVVNLHDRAPVWLNSVAGTNTITASAAITIPAYRKGMSFYFVPAANNTGAMTINIDGKGAVAIETSAGNALANADLRSGTQYMLVYNGTAMVVSGSNVGDQGETGVPSMYLDAIGDVDVDTSSNAALQEELVESFAFTTFVDNELVDISINIPLVVFTTGASTSDRNGACRIYLDGTAYNFFPGGAKQWNGTIITNGGQWCSRQNVPVDNMVSASRIRLLIPTAGVHSIRTHIAGSTTDTVVSLHGRRRYQVQPVKAAKGDPGPEGMSGTSALTIVRTIALANVTIASGLTSGTTLNGVLLATGDNVLLTAQTAPAENGVYTVVATGAASRHTNFATYDSNCARFFSVQSGTAKADTLWRCTSDQGGTLGTTAIVMSEFLSASATAGYPAGALSGLALSNNVTDAVNDIDIATGSCRDIANTADMLLASILTKRLDATWAVGTNQGGLDTGTIANGTYHVFLIKRSDTGVVDALFSTSASAPTMPTNYTSKRRIGSIVRASATILAFVQDGDDFSLVTPVQDVSTTNPGASAVTATLASVPTGIRVKAKMNVGCVNTAAAEAIYVSDLSTADLAPSTTASPGWTIASATNLFSYIAAATWTNTSKQVRYRMLTGNASSTAKINTLGWIDPRDRH